MRPPYRIEAVTRPEVEPVAVSDVMAYARLEDENLSPGEGDLISGWIVAAREAAENYTNRSLIARTLRAWLDMGGTRGPWMPGYYQLPVDYFDAVLVDCFALPKGPILSISSVTSYARDDATTVIDMQNYRLSGDRIVLAPGYSWPANLRSSGAVAIDYTAGYGPDPSDVPQAIRTAIAIHAASLYDTRGQCGCAVPESCKALLAPYRTISL